MANGLGKPNSVACPDCGIANFEGARFCRACGVSLQRENMTAHVTSDPPSLSERVRSFIFWTGRNSKPSIERGIKTTSTGLLFLTMAVITLFVLPGSGTTWWFWMLILVAFYGMSSGVTEIVKQAGGAKQNKQVRRSAFTQANYHQRELTENCPSVETNEIVTPASVIEGTMKQLKETLSGTPGSSVRR
ncbi:MAG TPA: hypothetical protein VFH31_20605 [Pyrinomonadaceae bacterium]|nr:hypothetical protein [Pyrinomonadaceae bacterium]